MIASGSNAVFAHPILDHGVWADWQHNGAGDPPTDLSTATSTGHVADIIGLQIENSGRSIFYIINSKDNVNTRMIELLRRWIDEYGDEEDPDLDLQLAELRSNRLALREQC